MSVTDNTETKFHALLQDQIRNEFTASQQYVAIAVYFDNKTLPQLAGFFYRQAVEERNHAMMLVRFLLDRDVHAEIPGIDPVRNTFDSVRDALVLAHDQERTVTEQINALTATARDERDFQGEQFMGWFLSEQVEEVASTRRLLRAAEHAGDDVLELEDFVSREMAAGATDPGAPAVAGGAL